VSGGVTSPPPPRRGSILRFVVGVLLCAGSIVVTIYGFFRLASVLEGGGYGTPAVRDALVVLGFAGALLAAGIATIIWDVSNRYEDPRT
jgi:formate hydrogenlyase subunit 3/multisubunit Na+/H+ antiporter MnhD subunit